MMNNPDRIKKYRDENNMSLRTMAYKLGVSPSFISDLENGNRKVNQAFADKAGMVLELDLHVHEWVCKTCGEPQ